MKREFFLKQFQDNDEYTKSKQYDDVYDFSCVQCTLHVGTGGGHKKETLLQPCCNPTQQLCNKSDL